MQPARQVASSPLPDLRKKRRRKDKKTPPPPPPPPPNPPLHVQPSVRRRFRGRLMPSPVPVRPSPLPRPPSSAEGAAEASRSSIRLSVAKVLELLGEIGDPAEGEVSGVRHSPTSPASSSPSSAPMQGSPPLAPSPCPPEEERATDQVGSSILHYFSSDRVVPAERSTLRLHTLLHDLHGKVEAAAAAAPAGHPVAAACVAAATAAAAVWDAFAEVVKNATEWEEQSKAAVHRETVQAERRREEAAAQRSLRRDLAACKSALRWRAAALKSAARRLPAASPSPRHYGIPWQQQQQQQQQHPEKYVLFVSTECPAPVLSEFLHRAVPADEGCAELLVSSPCSAAITFPSATGAASFALSLQHAAVYLPWPEKLSEGTRVDVQCPARPPPMAYLAAGMREGGLMPTASSRTVFCGPRLRMGLHRGAVLQDAHGVYGGALMKASLLCGAARGGEILVSEPVRADLDAWFNEDPEAVACERLPFPAVTEPGTHNWKEAGATPSLSSLLSSPEECVFLLISKTLLPRKPFLLPQNPKPYPHQRVAYNPYWWMRFCNYPPSTVFSWGEKPTPCPLPRPTPETEAMMLCDPLVLEEHALFSAFEASFRKGSEAACAAFSRAWRGESRAEVLLRDVLRRFSELDHRQVDT